MTRRHAVTGRGQPLNNPRGCIDTRSDDGGPLSYVLHLPGHLDDLMANRTVASAAALYVHFTDHSAERGMAIYHQSLAWGAGS